MPINRHIVITAAIITTAGVVRFWSGKSQRTNLVKILVGGYVLVLILALLDLSETLRPLASALADLAAVAALFASGLVEFLASLFGREARGKAVGE